MKIELVLDVYARVLEGLLVFLGLVLMVTVGLQIVGRYADFLPRYLWTEEVANYSLIWAIFLGAILGVRENRHFMVDLLPEKMPLWADIFSRLIYYLAMYLLAFVFVIYGIRFAEQGMVRHSMQLGVRLAVIYIAVPVTGLSWIGYITVNLAHEIYSFKIRKDDFNAGVQG